MNSYKKFSSCAEEIKCSVDTDKQESVLMIGSFPEDNEFVVGMFGRGIEIMASLCCAFDAHPELKVLVRRALATHDENKNDGDVQEIVKEFMKCLEKKHRS